MFLVRLGVLHFCRTCSVRLDVGFSSVVILRDTEQFEEEEEASCFFVSSLFLSGLHAAHLVMPQAKDCLVAVRSWGGGWRFLQGAASEWE